MGEYLNVTDVTFGIRLRSIGRRGRHGREAKREAAPPKPVALVGPRRAPGEAN